MASTEQQQKWQIRHPPFRDISPKLRRIQLPHSIQILNEDCLYMIFQHLNVFELLTVGMVSRRWFNISLNLMTGIQELDLVRYNQYGAGGRFVISPEFFLKEKFVFMTILIRTEGNLKTLHLPRYTAIKSRGGSSDEVLQRWGPQTGADWEKIMALCPNLETLGITYDSLYSESYSNMLSSVISSQLTNLRKLYLYCPNDDANKAYLRTAGETTEKFCADLTKDRENLDTIVLTQYPELEDLVSYNYQIPENYRNPPQQKVTGRFLLNRSGIVHLDLSNCSRLDRTIFSSTLRLNAETLEVLKVKQSFLQGFMDRTTLRWITFPAIEELHLTPDNAVAKDPDQVLPIVNKMQNLKVLTITYSTMTATFLPQLVSSCPRLVQLTLVGQCKVDQLKALERLLHLRSLNLYSINIISFGLTRGRIPAKSLEFLDSDSLQQMKLSGCANLTDDVVYDFIASNKSLSRLEVANCWDVHGAFLERCKSLKRPGSLEVVCSYRSRSGDFHKVRFRLRNHSFRLLSHQIIPREFMR